MNVGDSVKVVKWRDGGWTAEVLYIGKVRQVTDTEVHVKIITPSPYREGFKVCAIEVERVENVLPYFEE